MCSFRKSGLLTVILFVFLSANAQQKVPHNYIGALAVLDFTNTSIGGALEYERWLLVKKKWVLSAKADYIFDHKTANVVQPYDNLTESTRQACLMASSTFFTGRKNDHEGFFLGFSGGVNYTQYLEKENNGGRSTFVEKSSVIRPGYELFGGGQMKVSPRCSIRITAGVYTFYSNKGEFPDNLPLVLFFTKVSFGF